jgi:quinol monooxygenase YgiN
VYGLVAKLTATRGRRGELAEILAASSPEMPGCRSYVIAEDALDENILWVTEVWDSEESHAAAVKTPVVQRAIVDAKSMVAGFEKVATTRPIRGVR